MGAAKRRAKDWAEPSRPGLRKRKRLQSSPRLFSTGVPVVAMRKEAFRENAAAVRFAPAFLIAWASSRMTTFHWGRERSFSSPRSRP